MKAETVLWGGVVVHFAVIGAIYAAVGGEPAGVALLLLAAGLGGLVAGWLWGWRRRNAPRPEDDAEGDTGDSTGIVGVYPNVSLRPLATSVGMTATALGVVLGSWMTIAGVAIIASQMALLTRDADR